MTSKVKPMFNKFHPTLLLHSSKFDLACRKIKTAGKNQRLFKDIRSSPPAFAPEKH